MVRYTGKLMTLSSRGFEKIMSWDELPCNVIYHSYPLVNKGKMLSAGPTTTQRFHEMDTKLVKKFPVKAIMGKGNISKEFEQTLKENIVSYWEFPGGCGALAASFIKSQRCLTPEIKGVETMWLLKVSEMGPLYPRF